MALQGSTKEEIAASQIWAIHGNSFRKNEFHGNNS
jgi:hypothetical protein